MRCPPKLLTALSVGYFALLGLAIRFSIAVWTKDQVFGLTTTHPLEEPVNESMLSPSDRMPCLLKSGGAGYFLQNVLGCMLMAAIARHKKHMNEHLAAGLSSGLCGSLTTFATWMGEEAITIMNGYTFEAIVSVVSMLCVSLSCYRLGHFMAGCGMKDEPICFDDLCGMRTCLRMGPDVEVSSDEDEAAPVASPPVTSGRHVPDGRAEHRPLEPPEAAEWGLEVDEPRSWREPAPPEDIRLHPKLEVAIALFAFALIAAFIGTCLRYGQTLGLLSLAMAPFGALLRWQLSLYNASVQKYFHGMPLFTLLANLLGVVLNVFPAVLASRLDPLDDFSKLALGAVSTGFAGCLSTVSTLVAELRSDQIGKLRVRIAYFGLSFGLAMAIELPVLLLLRC